MPKIDFKDEYCESAMNQTRYFRKMYKSKEKDPKR